MRAEAEADNAVGKKYAAVPFYNCLYYRRGAVVEVIGAKRIAVVGNFEEEEDGLF